MFGVTIFGELELDKPGYYINKDNVRVDYRDISLKIAPMKFITVRVPFDYKITKDKDNLVLLENVGFTARQYNLTTKKFDYCNISWFITDKAKQ